MYYTTRTYTTTCVKIQMYINVLYHTLDKNAIAFARGTTANRSCSNIVQKTIEEKIIDLDKKRQ